MENGRIKKTLKNFANPVVGVSVQAFGRIGLEDVFPSFSIACLKYSEELEKMRRDNIPVFCLEELLEGKLEGKRNTTTVLKNKFSQKFLKENTPGSQKPILVLYRSSREVERLAKKFKWILAVNKQALYKKLENKIFFKNLIELLDIRKIPAEVKPLGRLVYKKLTLKYPEGFVIQIPSSGGGKGTFFINSEKDFKNCVTEIKKNTSLSSLSKIIVTEFIQGYSPSITGCVTEAGILQLPPQIQLIDIKELCLHKKNNGTFCGHDWSEAKKIKKQTAREMYVITEKVGNFLKKEGFRGIFGVDFLVSEKDNSVFPIEINPRLLGTFPVSTLIQLKSKEIPLIAFHVLEFAGKRCKIDPEKINKSFSNNKEGGHFFIASPFSPYKISGALKAGVYKIDSGENLKFLRPGYKLNHLKNKKEFLLVDGVPNVPRVEKGELLRILRVVSPVQISQKMGKELNPFGKRITASIYKALKIKNL